MQFLKRFLTKYDVGGAVCLAFFVFLGEFSVSSIPYAGIMGVALTFLFGCLTGYAVFSHLGEVIIGICTVAAFYFGFNAGYFSPSLFRVDSSVITVVATFICVPLFLWGIRIGYLRDKREQCHEVVERD